jgi:hypothetical protein
MDIFVMLIAILLIFLNSLSNFGGGSKLLLRYYNFHFAFSEWWMENYSE